MSDIDKIYERQIDRIYRICYMYLNSHADAEDAVQTVFLKYINAKKAFHDLEHEKAWFIITAKNCCRDTLRNFWRSRRIDIETLPEIPVWDKEQSEEVLIKLLSLPTKYKLVLYLYYYEEYSVKEISNLLHKNESTIRTQLSTGRKRLKIDLGGNFLEE